MSLLERDLLHGNLLDRVDALEAMLRDLQERAISPTDATLNPTFSNWAGLGGWVVTGKVLRDVDGMIILDPETAAISINSPEFETAGIQLQYNYGMPRAYIGDGADRYLKFAAGVLSLGGCVVTGIELGSELGIQGWQFDAVFSAVDADTVAWTAGTLRFVNGETFNVTAGDTGNIAAATYIYWSKADSETALQVTTAAGDAVGGNKVLIAVAWPGATEARFQVFGGRGGLLISGEDIESLSITTAEIANAAITAVKARPALLDWSHTLVFSSTDHNTVAWAAGSIVLASGTTYNIVAGNTGDIAAVTYIYLDIDVSTTVLQKTTTASSAVGNNRVLVAVAQNVAAGKKAEFQTFGGAGLGIPLVTADRIVAGTITTNEIAANTIVAGNIAAGTITGEKIAALTILAGNIKSGEITTTQIKAGTIKAVNIEAGTITGNEIKAVTITAAHIAANTITANEIAANTITAGQIAAGTITGTQIVGSTLSAIYADLGSITAGTITGGTIRTAASGARIQMDSTQIFGTDGTTTQWYATASTGKLYAGAGKVILDSSGIQLRGEGRLGIYDEVDAVIVGYLDAIRYGPCIRTSTQSVAWVYLDSNAAATYGGIMVRNKGLGVGSFTSGSTNIPAGDMWMTGSIRQSTALGCRVYRSTTQTITDNTTIDLSFDTEVHDTDACWAVGDPTKLYAKTAGYYMAGGEWWDNALATGAWRHFIDIELNDSLQLATDEIITTNGQRPRAAVATGMFYMAVNNYIKIRAFQSSGADRSSRAASATAHMHCCGWLVRVA